jgi:predicted MFS family arabinose efflux permease
MAEAEQVSGKIDNALRLGIPLENLVGLDAVYGGMKKGDADVAFLGVTDPGGQVLFVEGVSSSAFTHVMTAPAETMEGLADGQSLRADHLVTLRPLLAGTLYLGHDEQALVRPLIENFYDVGVVVLVALLLAFEVMLPVIVANIVQPSRAVVGVLKALAEGRTGLLTGHQVSGPLGSFAQRLDAFGRSIAGSLAKRLPSSGTASVLGVRLMAFLFVFAEELGRSFLPVYIADYAARTPNLDVNLASGILVGLHMTAVAVAMPFAAILYARLGRTRLYAAGALLATAGLVGTAMAGGYWDLLAWRMLSAIGYATTFVACQGFVIESTSSDNRASGMAMMLGGITLADICGPAFGGVMAERFGQSTTFLIAAGMAAFSCLLVARLMAGGSGVKETPQRITLAGFAAAFRNRRLLIQVLLAALPAKLLLTGFLYYLVPVTLLGIGWNPADVGRVVMIYGLTMLAGGPVFAHLADRWRNYAAVVALGGVMSSVFLLVVPLVPPDATLWAAILSVTALGLGQSMSITAQVTLVVGLTEKGELLRGQAPELTALRFIERFGGGAGPMIAAPLASHFGSSWAICLFGAYCLLSTLLYAALTVRSSGRRDTLSERTS